MVSNSRKALLGLCMAGALVFPAPVNAQDEVTNKILRLEKEIETLSHAVYKGQVAAPVASGAPLSGPSAANAEVRIQQLEGELRKLTGRLEEQDHKIRQLKNELARKTSDIELRLKDVEQGTSVAPLTSPKSQPSAVQKTGAVIKTTPQKAMVPPKSITTTQSLPGTGQPKAAQPMEAYEAAFALLKQGDYAGAEKGFTHFIKGYPNHVLAANAQYWLGESFYVRGQYERAARAFAEGYQKYPASTKTPDNLLKLAMSLAGLGNKSEACVALSQLEQEFAKGAEAVLARAAQEKSKLGCS